MELNIESLDEQSPKLCRNCPITLLFINCNQGKLYSFIQSNLWVGVEFVSRPNTASYPKTFKICAYCCYVRLATTIVRVGGMPWPQLELPDKSRAIKELVVCETFNQTIMHGWI